MPSERRRQLLSGVTALFQRTPPKSPTKLACLRFMRAVFANPGLYLTPDALGEAVVLDLEAAAWLQVLPPLTGGRWFVASIVAELWANRGEV